MAKVVCRRFGRAFKLEMVRVELGDSAFNVR